MGELKLERLFERWRELREPALLAEVFDRTSPELWQLALALARDVAEAEDVLQATYLAAIERADSFDEDRSLTAWLAGILVNQVRLARRDRARSIEPERVEPRPERDPHDRLERGELAGVLREALASLPSADRAVLELALIDGRKAAEIAREQGRNPGAVRMQIHRGLERLRKLLPPSFALGAAWTLTHGRGLAAVRAQVMERASSAQVVGGAAVTSSLVLGGAAVATKLVLSGTALVAAAVLAWFLWRPGESAAPDLVLEKAPDVQLASVDPEPAPVADAGIPARVEVAPIGAAPQAPAPAAPLHRFVVRGRVNGAPAGRETETKLSVSLLADVGIGKRSEAFARPDGSFEVDVTDDIGLLAGMTAKYAPDEHYSGVPRDLLVAADHPSCMPAEVRVPFASPEIERSPAGGETSIFRCELSLESAAVLSGSVVVPEGWSDKNECGDVTPPKVAMWAFAGESPDPGAPLDVAECDEQGRWRLRASRDGRFAVAALAQELRPATVAVELRVGREIALDPIVLTRGATITGIVRGARGAPAPARTDVTAMLAGHAGESAYEVPIRSCGAWFLSWTGERFGLPGYAARTEEGGRFLIEALDEAEYELQVTGVPDVAIAGGRRRPPELVVRAPAAGIELKDMPATLSFELTVDCRAPTREELDGVFLELLPGDAKLLRHNLDAKRALSFAFAVQVEPDAFYTLTPKSGRFLATPLEFGPLEAGEIFRTTVDLRHAESRGTLIVRLDHADHGKVSGALLQLFAPDGRADARPLLETRAHSDDGVFRWADLVPGRYRMRIRPSDSAFSEIGYLIGAQVEVDVLPSAETKLTLPLALGGRLHIGAKDEQGVFLPARVEARTAGGDAIATEFYCFGPESVSGPSAGLTGGWSSDHLPLPPGRYEFTLTCEGFEPQTVPVVLEAGKTTTIEVALRRK